MRWEWVPRLLYWCFFGGSANISWRVCSAPSSFRLWSAFIFSFFAPFFLFLCSVLTSVLKKSLVIPKLCQAGPPHHHLPPFFYCHGGFTSVHRRFGDERDGIIPIPALPLSRSNSLTKLSDSILAPTARVNLLCHLQSTRGSAKSRSSLCQNPPTAPLFRSIKVYFLPFFLSLQYVLSVCLYFLLFSLSFFLSPLYLAVFTLVETL